MRFLFPGVVCNYTFSYIFRKRLRLTFLREDNKTELVYTEGCSGKLHLEVKLYFYLHLYHTTCVKTAE